MNSEKISKPTSGYGMLLVAFIMVVLSIVSFTMAKTSGIFIATGMVGMLAFTLIVSGFFIINPNEAKVLTLFGTYKGTVKENGFLWANPFFLKKNISLRARNLNGNSIKVNDKIGNPIEIAAVIVWQVENTAKAAFEVDDYVHYVNIQSEAAVRHLAGSCPYDNWEDNEAIVTLRDGGDRASALLEKELDERFSRAGIKVLEARISHLSYAPEIAHAMLQRQQASAVVAARRLIVEGAVGMVEMALAKLSEREIVHLDEERKAAMVSNLLVVLCGDRSVNPVLNAGTLHH